MVPPSWIRPPGSPGLHTCSPLPAVEADIPCLPLSDPFPSPVFSLLTYFSWCPATILVNHYRFLLNRGKMKIHVHTSLRVQTHVRHADSASFSCVHGRGSVKSQRARTSGRSIRKESLAHANHHLGQCPACLQKRGFPLLPGMLCGVGRSLPQPELKDQGRQRPKNGAGVRGV